MSLKKILKILVFSMTALMFVLTFSLINACRADDAETAADTAAEDGRTAEEVVEDTEEEDMDEAETADEDYKTEEESGGDSAMLKITSPAFENDGDIPSKYTCDGDNINPELVFEGVPSDTVSLVLIVDDPDAPGGTWVHWTVWNIDPPTGSITENSLPSDAVEGNTDFGQPGYGGPCPPSGTHRYFFKLFALDTDLDLDASSAASNIEAAMEGHILASAELIGLYSR